MTLGELLTYLGNNPYYVVFYFVAIPLGAFLSNMLGKGEGHLNPWCKFYALLIYLSVIPGIFAILLNLYHLLFEKTSIYELNIMTQLIPIISMFLSLYIIRQNVSFDNIPGFGKITSFSGIIAGLMVLFFFLDKARLIAFTYIPFIWVIAILVILYIVIRYGMKYLIR